MSQITIPQGLILAGDEGRRLRVLASEVICKVSAETTGGRFSLFHITEPPQAGPPRHIHWREDETFYVLEGCLAVQVGDVASRIGPGGTAFLPKGVPHVYKNVGEGPARYLMMASPSGFEDFFAALDRAADAGPVTPDVVGKIGEAYGLEVVGPPLEG